MKERLKQKKGITLIALVVTIIVLLILAGITIATITGNNGIIKKAQEAKSNTEYDGWSEKIDLAIIDAEGNNRNADINDVIEELKNNDIIDDASQVNLETGDITTNEPSYVITDKLNDYISNVEITISKNPESEPSAGVILRVEKVEGIEGNINLSTVDVNSLTEQEKKDMLKTIDVFYANTLNKANVTSFEEYLDWNGYEKNEEEYLDWVEYFYGGIDEYLQFMIEELQGANVDMASSYVIINPDNNVLDVYEAIENGKYTFTIKEILTGKTYEKSVEVDNIDDNMFPYYVQSYWDKTISKICLRARNNGEQTEFQQAYIIFNGEKIEVTNCIVDSKIINVIAVAVYLEELGKIHFNGDVNGTMQIFELVKDGKTYLGVGEVSWRVE